MRLRSNGGLYIALICVLLISPALSQTAIGVGIYLQNCANINILNGLWLGEAMIYYFDNSTQALSPRTPFVANYGGSPSVITLLPAIGATNLLQTFLFSPDPSEYPFDSQSLEIAIEDNTGLTTQNLTFFWMPSLSGVSSDLRLKGWTWDPNTQGKAIIRNRPYYGGVYTVSEISWKFTIKRAKIVAVQVLLPPIFVLVSVLISFIMPITASITRIGIVGSALISEVSLHNGFKAANGTVGTLGIIDFFFLLTYIILVLSLAINVLVMILLRNNEKSPMATYLESRAKYFVWFVCPGLYTFIFFRGSMVWAAFICLLAPLIIYIVIDATIPRLKAIRRKMKTTQQKAKEEAVFDEEVEAKMQDGEGTDGAYDTRAAAVNAEIQAKANRKRAMENSDSLSANLYDTDSE